MQRFRTADFKDSNFDPAPPFLLELPGSNAGPPWQCNAVLRRLPGKRWVLALQRDEELRLGKLFFQARDYQREMRGYQALAAANLTTPAVIDNFESANPACYVVQYQYIDAPTLEQINASRPLTGTSEALLETVAVVASMHRAGLRQVDIHPGNFLFDGEQVHVVDTAAVRQHRAPLGGRLARENLADLIAQFSPGQLGNSDGIWQRYCSVHPKPGWQQEQLPAAIAKMRRLRWRHYRRKLTRSCSEFIASATTSRFSVWQRKADSDSLQQLLAQPDRALEQGKYLKQGNTATVAHTSLDGTAVAIKRYNIKHWRHRLNRCWRPTRAWRSWHNAHYLLFNGLRTPTPIAMMEERCGPLRGRGFFIAAFEQGTDLKTALDNADDAQRDALLQHFATIVLRYQAAGISHGDMKADNFIVTPAGVTIIDLDPMQHHRTAATLNRALRRDLKRFLANFTGTHQAAIAETLLPLLPDNLRP